MRIGLLSDTHGFLDEAVFGYLEQCDEIWHAGDFGNAEVFERLNAFRPARGVFGNIDGPDVRRLVPEELEWVCEGVRVYMIHAGGYPGNYARGLEPVLARKRPALFICGHSHILRVMRDPRLGILHMNPGACGHHGWHKVRTLLRFTATAGKISDVEAVELGPRGRSTIPAKASSLLPPSS